LSRWRWVARISSRPPPVSVSDYGIAGIAEDHVLLRVKIIHSSAWDVTQNQIPTRMFRAFNRRRNETLLWGQASDGCQVKLCPSVRFAARRRLHRHGRAGRRRQYLVRTLVATLAGVVWTVSAPELWVAAQRAMPGWARGRMNAAVIMVSQGAMALGGILLRRSP